MCQEKCLYSESSEALAQLPGCDEVVDVLSLEALKAKLDGAQGSLTWWVAELPLAQGWDLMIIKISSNLSHSIIFPPH